MNAIEHNTFSLARQDARTNVQFCKEHKYKNVFLWTASELSAAVNLYTRFGFRKTGEKTHDIWGKRVTEEKYRLDL
jgi:hypothetical protein